MTLLRKNIKINGQGRLECCSPWGSRVGLNWMTELKEIKTSCCFICITFAQIKEFLFYIMLFSHGFVPAKAVGWNSLLSLHGMCLCPEKKGWGREARSVAKLELWGHAELKATKYKPRYLVGFSSGFFWGFWLGVYFPPGLLVWSLVKGLSLFHLSFWKHRKRSLILVSSRGKHTFQSVVSGPAASASIRELINNAHSEVPSRPRGVPDGMWCVF